MSSNLEFFDPTKGFGFSSDARVQFPAAADLLSTLDRLGIARALVFHYEAKAFHPGLGNRRLWDELQSTPGAENRLFPCAVIAPVTRYDRAALPELRAAMQNKSVSATRYFSSPN